MPATPDMPATIAFSDFAGAGFSLGDAVIPAGAECLLLVDNAEQGEEVLNCLSGLRPPARGRASLLGRDLIHLPRDERLQVLARIGIVPSGGGLLTNLPAWQNIMLARQYQANLRYEKITETFADALRFCAQDHEPVEGWMSQLPDYLSHYQRRLTAFLRLMLCSPAVCIYENLMGNLHTHQQESLLALTRRFHAQRPGRISLYVEFDPLPLTTPWSGQTLQARP